MCVILLPWLVKKSAIFLADIRLPTLLIKNFRIFSSKLASTTLFFSITSFINTVLYMPFIAFSYKFSSFFMVIIPGIPPNFTYSINLSSNVFLSSSDVKFTYSLKDNGNTFISIYLPERYVDNSEDNRYAFEPVI